MGGEWRDANLGDLTDFISGGTPSKENPSYWGGSIPWVSAKDMRQFYVADTEDHLTEDGVRNGTKLAPSGSTLMLVRGMTLLNNVPICVIRRPMAFNQDVKALRPKPGVRDDFLPYLLLGKKNQLLNLVDLAGHGTGRLNAVDLNSLEVVLPPGPEQRAIACFFGTLDEKIELNRQMNETLEGIARAIFKSWFVDFDPVRANAKGLDVGLSKHVANLFPNSFSRLGGQETPDGWSRVSFSKTIEIIGGGTPKTSVAEYWNGDIPWFSVVDAPAESDVWVIGTEKQITQAGVDNSSTKVFPIGTTIISARGTVGRVALVGIPMAMNQSCYGLRGERGGTGAYTYFSTRQLVSVLRQHAHGSVFDTITRETFDGVSVPFPPGPVIEAFEKLVDPLILRMRRALFQSSALAATRDAMLPKLISGELRVPDAERIVGGRL